MPCGVYAEVPEESAVLNAEIISGRGVPGVGSTEGESVFGRAFDVG